MFGKTQEVSQKEKTPFYPRSSYAAAKQPTRARSAWSLAGRRIYRWGERYETCCISASARWAYGTETEEL